MNILDENILESQRRLLRNWRITARQIGYDIGRQGMKDEEIIPFLHQLHKPILFSRDTDFYNRRLCHARYCLVYLTVQKQEVAIFIRRFLRHPRFATQAKRLGTVVQVSHVGLSVWRLPAEEEATFEWSS